jgi:hypothetical protein
MAPTCQEESSQKLNTDLTALQAKVNNDISAIHAKMHYIHDQLGSGIDEVISTLKQLMNKFQGPSSSDPPLYTEGVDSNQPLHANSLPCDPCLPRVEVNKFVVSDPTAWVTQMEHYFSLHSITDELTKLRYEILYLDLER